MNAPSLHLEVANAMTVDVEDYFQVSAFDRHVGRHEWETMECRVERNVERLLALFERREVRATFFTLGWMVQRYPSMIRDIVRAGHELASHGSAHKRASEQSRIDFQQDVDSARKMLEDVGGTAV